MLDLKEKIGECNSENICDTVSHYKERITYLESLVRKYKFDYLTGLMGKRDFIEKFDRVFEEYKFADEQFFLVLVDINNLHNINRMQGYYKGDMIIKDVGAVLLKKFQFHQIFRISGDEFALLIRCYHITEEELIKQLDDIDKITYYIQQTENFTSPKQMFKYTDKQLSEKKQKSDEKRV